MPNKNKLSIYMIKDEFTRHDEIIDEYDQSVPFANIGTVYIKNSYINTPDWVESFFAGRILPAAIFTANARAVLIVNVPINKKASRNFALTLGYGKNMLKEDVVEDRFGIKVVLNTIIEDSLRRINKTNIGGNSKISIEQLPLKSKINEFGLDINRDLVSYIAGISEDEDYAAGILAGGDILSLSAEVDITNIVDFLKKTYTKYVMTNYRKKFEWIDQIQDVKDTRIIDALNSRVVELVNSGSPDIWMAVPEIVEWSEISGFKYCGKDLYNDIYVDKVKDSFREGLSDIDQLKKKRIVTISAVDGQIKHSWCASRCIFGEVVMNGKAYCINGGKWYCINNDFVKEIDEEYSRTRISGIVFDDFNDNHDSESLYSISFKNNHAENYIVMDEKTISYGGGHSSIELCDILSDSMELIHIKPYSSSLTLSHLFSQAAVSSELILTDEIFFKSANKKIAEVAGNKKYAIVDRRKIKIVFGIISKCPADLPHIPFFSKVSFRYTKRRLEAFGLDVSIKTIKDIRQIKKKPSKKPSK